MIRGLFAAGMMVLGFCAAVFGQDVLEYDPNWNPNEDPAFKARYMLRELSLEFERVDPRRGIKGLIRNEGNQTLTRVRVLLTFNHDDGKPSGEYEFSALPWAGPVGKGEPDEKALGPGMTRHFLVYPSSVPSGWSESWQADIIAVTFATKQSP